MLNTIQLFIYINFINPHNKYWAMEENENEIKQLWNYLVVNYLQTNGYEIAKDALLREIGQVPDNLTMKSVSQRLGFKDQIKQKVVESREFESVLEALWDQLVNVSDQQKTETTSKA